MEREMLEHPAVAICTKETRFAIVPYSIEGHRATSVASIQAARAGLGQKRVHACART